MTVTNQSNIRELITCYPFLAKTLFEDYGLHCLGCFVAEVDTLENGAKSHGMNDEEIDKMITHLNKIIGEENK